MNLANFLLINGRDKNGNPYEIAHDLARLIGNDLDIDIRVLCFKISQEIVVKW